MSITKPSGIRMRIMKEEDIETVRALERVCFSDPWPENAFHECVSNDCYYAYVVTDKQDEICGFCVLRKILDIGELMNIAVRADMRRRGIGKLMLGELFDVSRALGITELQLEVRESNTGARLLYEETGFVRNGLRKDYYQNPDEHAVLMSKVLQLHD